jgi:hypothetical protein
VWLWWLLLLSAATAAGGMSKFAASIVAFLGSESEPSHLARHGKSLVEGVVVQVGVVADIVNKLDTILIVNATLFVDDYVTTEEMMLILIMMLKLL